MMSLPNPSHLLHLSIGTTRRTEIRSDPTFSQELYEINTLCDSVAPSCKTCKARISFPVSPSSVRSCVNGNPWPNDIDTEHTGREIAHQGQQTTCGSYLRYGQYRMISQRIAGIGTSVKHGAAHIRPWNIILRVTVTQRCL